MKITRQSIRITCINDAQKKKLMTLTCLLNKPVEVTAPRSNAHSDPAKPQLYMGLIHGVPVEMEVKEITEEIGAEWVNRLGRKIEGAEPTSTTVYFAMKDELPEFVSLGFMRKRVKTYVPPPLRCLKCQTYGHKAKY